MGILFGFGCLGVVVAVVIGLAIASVILRGAVGLANRMVGPANANAPIGWDWDADEEDEPVLPEGTRAVPEPTLGKGMFIMLLAGLTNFILGVGLRWFLSLEAGQRDSDETAIAAAAHLLGVAAGFIVLMWLLAASLPTTPKRAALVALLFHLLVVAIAGFVLGLAYVALG